MQIRENVLIWADVAILSPSLRLPLHDCSSCSAPNAQTSRMLLDQHGVGEQVRSLDEPSILPAST